MDTSSPNFPPPPVTQYFDDVLSDFRHWLRRALDNCDAAVRENPRQSLLAAFALGAVVRHLPLPAIFTTALRTAFAAAPPAVAVIGACSLLEYCRSAAGECGHASRPPRYTERPDEFPLEGDGHTIIPGSGPPIVNPPAGIVT